MTSAKTTASPQPLAGETAQEIGPQLPTDAEERKVAELEYDLLLARMLLGAHGYLVMAPDRIVGLLGAPFYRGFSGAPAPLVDRYGQDIDQRGRVYTR